MFWLTAISISIFNIMYHNGIKFTKIIVTAFIQGNVFILMI